MLGLLPSFAVGQHFQDVDSHFYLVFCLLDVLLELKLDIKAILEKLRKSCHNLKTRTLLLFVDS